MKKGNQLPIPITTALRLKSHNKLTSEHKNIKIQQPNRENNKQRSPMA